jgi:hypothetical protein
LVNPIVIDSDNAGQYSSLAIGHDGAPVMSYYAAGIDNLRVAKCSATACATSITVSTPVVNRTVFVLDAANVGSYASITIGVDGMPLIAYQDASFGSVKAVHCSNVRCEPFVRRR